MKMARRVFDIELCHSQKESPSPYRFTKQIKETLGQFLTGLPRILLNWCFFGE